MGIGGSIAWFSSVAVVAVSSDYISFTSDIGVDDDVGSSGSIAFQAYTDNVLAFDSGVMTGVSATQSINVSLVGKTSLRIVVTGAGDGINFDHGNWANARLNTSTGFTFLSDIVWISATNGDGIIRLNRSNRNTVLKLNDVTYAKGIGVHAVSEIVYNLARYTGPTTYTSFTSDIGVDDNVGSSGSIVFQVYTDDNVLAFDSGVMTGVSATQSLNVSLVGKTSLRIIVTGAGNGITSDHGNWANARLNTSTGFVFLSDIAWLSASVGFGIARLDRSSSDNVLTLNGVTYTKGIGVHAESEIVYNLV